MNNGNLAGQGNASGIALMNWLPLPNADPFTNASGYNYVQEVIQQQNGSIFHTRADYSINDNNKLYATYGRQKQITQDPVAYGYAAAGFGAVSGAGDERRLFRIFSRSPIRMSLGRALPTSSTRRFR